MESTLLKIVSEGGLAGIVILLIAVIYKLVSNHMNHNTQVLTDLTVVLKELKQLINDKIK